MNTKKSIITYVLICLMWGIFISAENAEFIEKPTVKSEKDEIRISFKLNKILFIRKSCYAFSSLRLQGVFTG